jgi:hypothetical protein
MFTQLNCELNRAKTFPYKVGSGKIPERTGSLPKRTVVGKLPTTTGWQPARRVLNIKHLQKATQK